MNEKMKVMKIEDMFVWVKPIEIEACISCERTSCSKDGNIFKCINSLNLPIKIGSCVLVNAPIKNQIIQVIKNLLLPSIIAVLIYSFGISYFLPKGISEALIIASSLLSFSIIALCMYFFSMKKKTKQKRY